MADATVTFAAPGIFKAISEVKSLNREIQRTEKAEQKVKNTRKQSTNQAVNDQKRIRREVNKTTKAVGRQAAAGRGVLGRQGAVAQGGRVLGRVGGRIGTIGNQVGTGAAGGAGLAALSAAAIVAGLALTSLTAASVRQENIAAKITQSNQQILSGQQSLRRAGATQALGFGTKNAAPFREIIARGGIQGSLAAGERLRGEGISNADQQILGAIKSGAVKSLGIKSVEDIIRTGNRLGIQADFTKLKSLGPRGIERLKDTGGVDDLVFGLGGKRDTQRALRDVRQFEESGVGQRLGQQDRIQGQINQEIFSRFLGGSGSAALSEKLVNLRAAEAVAIQKVVDALTREAEIAESKADAEFEIIRRIRETSNFLFGTGGSRSQEFQDINDARANLR